VGASTFEAFGGPGYAAPKGILCGRLAIPMHSRDGVLLAYCGRTVKNESPMLLFPSGFDPHATIFNAHRVAEGELYLVRDPLDVLKAFENGIENVVSFLTEGITAQQLEQLASLMDEKKIDTLSLYDIRKRRLENTPIYASLGFEVTGKIKLPGGPTIYLMWRKLRTPA
jgi:hypothetical protein